MATVSNRSFGLERCLLAGFLAAAVALCFAPACFAQGLRARTCVRGAVFVAVEGRHVIKALEAVGERASERCVCSVAGVHHQIARFPRKEVAAGLRASKARRGVVHAFMLFPRRNGCKRSGASGYRATKSLRGASSWGGLFVRSRVLSLRGRGR